MIEIILTRGLPASGKSTWARKMVQDHPDKYVRCNKDDLREMMFNSVWSKSKEKLVLHVRDTIVLDCLEKRMSVIIDDTNLDDSHIKRMRELAAPYKDVVIKTQDFTNVSLEECLKRNAARPKPVPEFVIKDMYKKYLAVDETAKLTRDLSSLIRTDFDSNLEYAVVIDLDGTLSINDGHRGWYNEDLVFNDKPNIFLVNVLKGLELQFDKIGKKLKYIYVSGRKDKCRADTKAFILTKATLPVDELYMRADIDNRKDSIVKKEIYDEHIKGKYNIMGVFDDRPQVLAMWYEQGLPIFRIGNPTLADF